MNRTSVTMVLVVFCTLGCLSAISPTVNLTMTILVIATLVIGGGIAITAFVALNHDTEPETPKQVPPDLAARR